MNIFLVAGHSSQDPGAVANNTTEHKEVWMIMQEVSANLLCKGLDVFLLPETCDLPKQIDAVNAMGSEDDVLFNLHMNSGKPSSTGLMVFYYSGSEESKQRATSIADNLSFNTGLPNLGIQGDEESRLKRLGIIRDTKPWAFLIECGFITNGSDLETVRSKGAYALTATILHYLHQYNNLSSMSCKTPLKEKMTSVMVEINNIILHVSQNNENNAELTNVISALELLQRKRKTITREDVGKVIEICERIQNNRAFPDEHVSWVVQQLSTLQQHLSSLTACT